MESCPKCHKPLSGSYSSCPICGEDLGESSPSEWIMIGTIENKLAADFARETLESYNVPVVIISKSGFFGDVGLPLNPIHSTASGGMFEVSVPQEHREEAMQIVKMTVGESWHPEEN